jgi:hypothetical protein
MTNLPGFILYYQKNKKEKMSESGQAGLKD